MTRPDDKRPEPQPFYIDSPDAPLAGWLHRPAGAVRQAVLLCSPFGREEISAHRAWRDLAQDLAARGHCVLRFDFAGCGDSGGDEGSSDLVGAWLRSVAAALVALRRASGRDRVVLAGLRLGALLALEAADGRTDVAALVAVAPVLSGRAYLRELRAMQAAAATTGAGSVEPGFDGLESGGFAFPTSAQAALEALDWRQPSRPPAPRVVLVDRAELPVSDRWAASLQSLGVEVRVERQPGFEGLMLDPHHAQVPQALWQAVVEAVEALPDPGGEPLADRVDLPAATRVDGVDERMLRLTALAVPLAAVHSRPPPGVAPTGRVIVLLNAGATRRIGPSRSYVCLARRLARRGHEVLRVDLAGLGDSPAQPGAADSVVYTATAVAEVLAIVDTVRSWPGVRTIALAGLCAGAYHSFKAAVRGAPVQAVMAINPLTFFWRDDLSLDAPLRPHEVIGEMDRYREGLLSAARWRKLLRGEVDLRHLRAVLSGWLAARLRHGLRTLARAVRWPLRDDLARELRTVTARGVALEFLFADDEPGLALLHDQGGGIVRQLQREGRLRIHPVAGADHVFTRWAPRQRFLDLAIARLEAASDAPLNEGRNRE